MNRWIVLAAVSAVLVVPGCSKTTHTTIPASSTSEQSTTTTTTSSATSTTDSSSSDSGGGSAPLGAQACVDITQANVDLATASDAGAARTAGDLFEKYDPPSQVKDAIEAWIKQVCPL